MYHGNSAHFTHDKLSEIKGFGFLIVILIVPSLVVIQHDFSRFWNAFKRSLSRRHFPAGLRAGMWIGTGLLVAVNTVTVGYWVSFGELLAPLAPLAKMLPSLSGGTLSLLVAVTASAIVSLLLLGVMALFRK